MKQQKGFTLIELIVVIVILGILAATAMPKFSNLAVDARVAKMHGLAASLKGATAMAHGQSLSQALSSSSYVTLENGTRVDMLWYYPSASPSGIAAAIEHVGSGYISNVGPSTGEWDFFPDNNRTTCVVRYFASSGIQPPVTGTLQVPFVDDSAVTGASGIANC